MDAKQRQTHERSAQSFQIFHFTHFVKFIDSSLIVISFLVKFKWVNLAADSQRKRAQRAGLCESCGKWSCNAQSPHGMQIAEQIQRCTTVLAYGRHSWNHEQTVLYFRPINEDAARKHARQINKLESNRHKSSCIRSAHSHAHTAVAASPCHESTEIEMKPTNTIKVKDTHGKKLGSASDVAIAAVFSHHKFAYECVSVHSLQSSMSTIWYIFNCIRSIRFRLLLFLWKQKKNYYPLVVWGASCQFWRWRVKRLLSALSSAFYFRIAILFDLL